MKLIKCPYCEKEGDEVWLNGVVHMDNHIRGSHQMVSYRTIEDQIASWKMIGLYEERNTEE